MAGIGLAAVAILLAIVAIRGGDEGDTDDPPIEPAADVTVVEALRDVPAHRVITDQDVREVRVPGVGGCNGQHEQRE